MSDRSKQNNDEGTEQTEKLPVKIAAEAKLNIERKKISTEIIPEDVTRANSAAWLDLISPLTEWAGLKGDELRHKRELLRYYREKTLFSIIEDGINRANKKSLKLNKIPLKFIVPFIEKASLEEEDKSLNGLWSGLFSSAATEYKPEYIHFSNIIAQMSKSQAEAFRDLIDTKDANALELSHDTISSYYYQHIVRSSLIKTLLKIKKDKNYCNNIMDEIVGTFNIFGVEYVHGSADFGEDGYYDIVPEDYTYTNHDDIDYRILEALGLIRYVETDWFEVKDFSLIVMYYHITELGLRFAVSCGIVE